MPYRSRRRAIARRRAVAVLALLVVASGAWYAADTVGSSSPSTSVTTTSGDPSASGTPTTSPTTTTAPTTTSTTLPTTGQATGLGTYQVDTARLVIPDPASSTASLPATVWYPRASGSHPLLVFSQGFREPVSVYATLLTDWASAGFVVVAPTFPHTNPPPHLTTPSTPTWTGIRQEGHEANHPNVLRVVLDAVLADTTTRGSVLSGRIDAQEVGLVGQSDGGDVSLALADNSRWATPRVKAVAVLSGTEWAPFGGSYFTGPAIPLLDVQSNADAKNPTACGVQLYDQAPQPKFFLKLFGITHMGAYATDNAYRTVVAAVTTRFFDAELAGYRSALTGIGAVANRPGISAITGAAAAPPPTGPPTCATAP